MSSCRKTFFAAVILCLSCAVSAAQVHVRPTVTKKGSYRQGHVRTKPDRTQANNYSAKGNVNPYTGKRGSHKVKH